MERMCELVDRLLREEQASGKRRAEALKAVGERLELAPSSVERYAGAAHWRERDWKLLAIQEVERRLKNGEGLMSACAAAAEKFGLKPNTVQKVYYWWTAPARPAGERRGKRVETVGETRTAARPADAGDLEAAVLELAGRHPRRVPQSEIEAVAKRFGVGVITVMSLLGDAAKKGVWQARLAEMEAELERLREENMGLRRRAEAAEAELRSVRHDLEAARAALEEIRRAVLAA